MVALTSRAMRVGSAAFALGILTSPASAKRSATIAPSACAAHALEAAMRSGLPVETITRVMMAESGGDPRAVSPKGAMGCMQIIPATWAYLAPRYALGSDPFDARQNMIGGAVYLAELKQRFGWAGVFAAYNAGPARYRRYIATGEPLPAETVAYAGRLGGTGVAASAAPARTRWQEAALFLVRGAGTLPAVTPAPQFAASPPPAIATAPGSAARAPLLRVPTTLFPLAASGPNQSR